MGPTIILDKSTLQSLSKSEVTALHRYYLVNIVPMLPIEILADLAKKNLAFSHESKVREYASKLRSYSSAFSVHYRELLIGSLVGMEPSADGRPVVGPGTAFSSNVGEAGILLEPAEEERAVIEWKAGSFQESEKVAAEHWRRAISEIDLESVQKVLRAGFEAIPKIDEPIELIRSLDDLTNSPRLQERFLKTLLEDFQLPSAIGRRALSRWQHCGYSSLAEFSPYALHCFRVNLFFYLGLFHSCSFVGTRATNRVDLEYLYYLPFCNVFSSGDKFHANIAPLFMNSKQHYVSREVLKSDLQELAVKLEGNLDSVRDQIWPPTSNDSFTWKMWDEFCVKSNQSSRKTLKDMSENERKALMEKLRPVVQGAKRAANSTKPFAVPDDEESRYVVKKFQVRLDEPCMCGSGKTFGNCCLKGTSPSEG